MIKQSLGVLLFITPIMYLLSVETGSWWKGDLLGLVVLIGLSLVIEGTIGEKMNKINQRLDDLEDNESNKFPEIDEF